MAARTILSASACRPRGGSFPAAPTGTVSADDAPHLVSVGAVSPCSEEDVEILVVQEQHSRASRPVRTEGSTKLHAILLLGVVLLVGALSIVYFTLRMHGGPPTFINPVVPNNAPDPGVVRLGDQFFAATTSGTIGVAQNAFPLLASSSLVAWEVHNYVFPGYEHPEWTNGLDFAAPELHAVGSRINVYFTARHRDNVLCIGAAWAETPDGPFHDVGRPLVHDPAGDCSDPNFFRDANGTQYLLWSAPPPHMDASGAQSRLVIQRLSGDGLQLVGEQMDLLRAGLAWEGGLVRAPWLLRRNEWYFLFYSASPPDSGASAIGVARAVTPLGPYEKLERPVVHTPLNASVAWEGPGHCSVVRVSAHDGPNAQFYMVYSAWERGRVGGRHPRMMLAEPVRWLVDWPRVNDGLPSDYKQPQPRMPAS